MSLIVWSFSYALCEKGSAFASNADADLAALYTRLSAATPTRKIAYKAIKPDAFFVVSGQEGPVKFYTRFDRNPAATPVA